MAEWIWLDAKRYPAQQTTRCTTFGREETAFAVAEFQKIVTLRERPRRVFLRVSGDTKYWLWANGRFLGMGPVCAGGDYGNTLPMPWYYASHYEEQIEDKSIRLFARVQLSPSVMTDYSCGHGGFYLEGRAEYADGTCEVFETDEDWQVRLNGQYTSSLQADFSLKAGAWEKAARVKPVWRLRDSALPPLYEERIAASVTALKAESGETAEVTAFFDRIYAGYMAFELRAAGRCTVEVTPFELEGQEDTPEVIVFDGDADYRGLQMRSAGGCHVRLINQGDMEARIEHLAIISTHYPVESEGHFFCSDEGLNKVYDVCRHTLKICRQSLHLDSPRHQETLGCTGDYYVESLMSYFTFGDARLTRLDIVRTADWLTMADGFMFHTTYSLIWVEMLNDCFMFTGDESLLRETKQALDVLLERFNDYVGESGLIETPPSWMFVDWIMVDGLSMHHPPKALGQSVLCALYYRALHTAEGIYRRLGDEARALSCAERAARLGTAFNALLYDEERGLYFDGLNTPQGACTRPLPEHMMDVSPFMPDNVKKRYYSKQANTMAVLCGLCSGERAQRIMQRVMEDEVLVDFQPYFAHYVLDALWRTGQFKRYVLDLIGRWKPMVSACSKGLQEGWIKPGDSYSFDHSHAWGGTPAYQLPCRLLGFEMREPGFGRIALHPDAMGLEWVDIAMPTPRGMLRCVIKDGRVTIEKPDGLIVDVEN